MVVDDMRAVGRIAQSVHRIELIRRRAHRRQRRAHRLHVVVALHVQRLVERRDADGQIRHRHHEQRCAQAVFVAVIDVVLTQLRIVDPAWNALLHRTHAQRRLVVPERQVHQPLDESGRLTAIDHFATGRDGALIGVQIGRVGDVFDQAAFRGGTVQGSLRATQYLDPLQIVGVHIGAEEHPVRLRA